MRARRIHNSVKTDPHSTRDARRAFEAERRRMDRVNGSWADMAERRERAKNAPEECEPEPRVVAVDAVERDERKKALMNNIYDLECGRRGGYILWYGVSAFAVIAGVGVAGISIATGAAFMLVGAGIGALTTVLLRKAPGKIKEAREELKILDGKRE